MGRLLRRVFASSSDVSILPSSSSMIPLPNTTSHSQQSTLFSRVHQKLPSFWLIVHILSLFSVLFLAASIYSPISTSPFITISTLLFNSNAYYSSNSNKPSDELTIDWLQAIHSVPHPIDLALETKRGDLHWNPTEIYPPGYVKVQKGTFRDKYPSVTIEGSDTFDEVYVISNERCQRQFQQFSTRANTVKLRHLKITAVPGRDINLDAPPIPLAQNVVEHLKSLGKLESALLKRHVGYSAAHYEIWKTVVEKKKQRVLVIDDTLFPKDRLLKEMPILFNAVDQESVAGLQPWHLVLFRRRLATKEEIGKQDNAQEEVEEEDEEVWSPNARFPVVRAQPSVGAGIYGLSLDGAMWLLENFGAYREPLDIQLSLLQKEFADDFVVLSACSAKQTPNCPNLVSEISIPESQSAYECMWRRIQESKQ